MDIYKTCHEIIQPYGFFWQLRYQVVHFRTSSNIHDSADLFSHRKSFLWVRPTLEPVDRFQWNLCWMRLNMQNIFWKMQLQVRTVRVVNAHIVWTRGHKLLIAFVRYSNCISLCRYNYPDAVSQRGSAKTNASLVKHKHKLLMTR